MIGYKGFNSDLTCRNFQYKIGKTYELDGELEICKNGFHFCDNVQSIYNYYIKSDGLRICKIEALGEIQIKDDKYCTNKIKILEEITDIVSNAIVRRNYGL